MLGVRALAHVHQVHKMFHMQLVIQLYLQAMTILAHLVTPVAILTIYRETVSITINQQAAIHLLSKLILITH